MATMTKEAAQFVADAIMQCDGWYIRLEEKQDGWIVWGLHESGARFRSDLYISRGGGRMRVYLGKEVRWTIEREKFLRKHHFTS